MVWVMLLVFFNSEKDDELLGEFASEIYSKQCPCQCWIAHPRVTTAAEMVGTALWLS